jgi:hypothetical protein
MADVMFRAANDNRRLPSGPRDESHLTIEELLTDPIVRDLMHADRVDPTAFESLLRSLPMDKSSLVLSSKREPPSPR